MPIRQFKLQHQAAAATLAAGGTVAEAAKAALGVAERTVENWKNDPAFKDLVDQYVVEIESRTVDAILGATIAEKASRVQRLELRWNQTALMLERMLDDLAGGERFFPSGTAGKDKLGLFIQYMKAEKDLSKEAAEELGQRITRMSLDTLSDEDFARVVKMLAEQGQLPDDIRTEPEPEAEAS